MNRRTRAWALLGAVGCSWACGNDPAPAGGSGGAAPSAGSGGATTTTAGSSSGGTATSAGAAAGGSAGTAAGSGGQNTSGTASGGSNGGTSAGMGGALTGGTGGAGGAGGSGGGANTLPKRVLLYHFSTLAIDGVDKQIALLKTQLTTWGYESEDSVKPDDISTTNLARFAGVAMINTCFEPFGAGKTGDTQTAALKAFVENDGGGLFGTHCASVTFQSANPPNAYNVLLGGRGGPNGDNFTGKSTCTPTAEAHVSTAMLPATFDFNGNIDNADYVAPDTKVLVKCKWSGGTMKETAVSWYRTAGKGRVFYTNFAKVDADLSDATLGQKHILLGLGWTLGR